MSFEISLNFHNGSALLEFSRRCFEGRARCEPRFLESFDSQTRSRLEHMNEHSNKSANFISNDTKLMRKVGLDYSSTCKDDMSGEGGGGGGYLRTLIDIVTMAAIF